MFCRPTRLAFDAEDPAQAELGRGTLESKLGAFARATHPMGKPRERPERRQLDVQCRLPGRQEGLVQFCK
jgi:hypothetical protein